MEMKPNMYVTVAYELYVNNAKRIHELVEKAPEEHPFQFITGMGMTLDAFEEQVINLNQGDAFDFEIKQDEAYGAYEQERVLNLSKDVLAVNGRFDKDGVYPGAVIPLVNSDGNRFHGLVLEVGDDTVKVDLNHPFAGKDLHFKGHIVTKREATAEEIQGMINMMSGEGCGCGCEDCGGECGGHEDGECCGGHDHKHGDGECCGGHGHKHGEGECCGGHGHKHGEGECCGGHDHKHGEGECCGHKHD